MYRVRGAAAQGDGLTMETLTLNVKKRYFDQIKSGDKTHEYRLQTAYWRKRVYGRIYDYVVICCGYPAKNDNTRRLTFLWNGYQSIEITHEFFGDVSMPVYAIDLTMPVITTD